MQQNLKQERNVNVYKKIEVNFENAWRSAKSLNHTHIYLYLSVI